jgi:hypothetical protein
MIDSRAKGRNAEMKARDELRKLTDLRWERTPMSGALGAQHKLKGDLYVPEVALRYCVEVKHYKDDHISTKIITSVKPMFFEWWDQTIREAEQMEKLPLLLFKHNRSKWFAAFCDPSIQLKVMDSEVKAITIQPDEVMICLLTDFCKYARFV